MELLNARPQGYCREDTKWSDAFFIAVEESKSIYLAVGLDCLQHIVGFDVEV
jgi:hypothetical protein